MSSFQLFPRCIDFSTCAPIEPCSCAAELCVRINRNCTTCPFNQCLAAPVTSSSKGGVSKGAVAGSIIGVVIFFAIAIFLFLRHRKRALVRRHRSSVREIKKDIPAPAETVLNRPDPTEKPPSERDTVRVYSSHSSTTIDLDPHSNSSHPPDGFNHNPFEDTNSIQTAGTEATNVIQIAFVPPGSNRESLSHSEASAGQSSNSSFPVRPARSPELNLNLDHVNVSHDNLRSNGYSQSTISGISSRNSYMSSASYSSDFLNEAPMIMTPTKGAVRQVVGVVKAEVISAGSLNSANNSSDSLKPPAYSKPVVKSPLASTSFGPNDMVREESEESHESHGDPFADKHTSTQVEYATSAAPSNLTFAQAHESVVTEWDPKIPKQPWSRSTEERPSSMSTQAGSVIDIASATRVNVGLKSPASANSYRTTMGRLVTPPSNPGTLQEQQQRALAHAQAQAQAQGLDRRRISNSSVLSAASTRADSILESFPFVPPSPISDRPIRSPPASPLAQQSFTNGSVSPLYKHTFVVAPPSPLNAQSFTVEASNKTFISQDPLSDSLPAPPDRRTLLGLSTGSQLSTASSGLGSFPFQIESEPTVDNGPPPSSFANRTRASLDTLALTSDLSSYPLAFDRDVAMPKRN
ncbi:hypothetical protein BDN70DRAFT_875578 [Pholiota conissans]|uniref:Membrane anchor Opy2 N-terminal domain-containing protein n=1 Tax=Pholiota conissans TaxID=109636 RepID=A0A9P6D3T6_9AGAR|nr:hypothetical protein BDN70DRAFT_875578 [Pholiota conissans]